MYEKRNFSGLSEKEVLENRKKYGKNVLEKIVQDSFIKQFIRTLGDPIIRILLIALGIKTVFLFQEFDWFETIGIVIAIFLASFISTISEYGSEKAFEKLQEEAERIKTRVIREGKILEIPIEEIVVNDLVVLSIGDKVPADGVLVDGEVTIDESSLNGEAKESYKIPFVGGVNPKEENLLYRGSVVYAKEGIMEVKKVGSETFYGKLAKELQEKQPESPLKIRLRHLAKIISRIGYIGAFLVAFSYLFSILVIDNQFNMAKIIEDVTNFPFLFGHILYALTLSVTIIVVAVPEGLPMMITLVLSSNMKRMLKNKVLVRKLMGIETAGNLNILFTDKTGTLTKGKLEVVGIRLGDAKVYRTIDEVRRYPRLEKIVRQSIYYNNGARFSENLEVIGGNITDRALLHFLGKPLNDKVQVLDSTPFDSKMKYSSCIIKDEEELCLIKGAPEKILPFCDSYYTEMGKRMPFYHSKKVEEEVKRKTQEGIRVLALATSRDRRRVRSFSHLSLVGIIYIKDEVRSEAVEGIKLVSEAGIKTVMITGDNKDTAIAIGKEVGLLNSSDDIVLTSDEFSQLSDEKVKQILPRLSILSRALPQDKSRLVRLSQELDLVVGMTGDGVNDAPALKRADVGFAMGSGTEVAKEASDVVILDDNFASIAKAILFGRTIFKSIRKFIIFQLTVNLCAISLSILGPFIGVDTPVTVIQMLWINMVMDTLAGIAFAYEPPLLEYMKEKPKKKDEAIINRYMMDEIIFTGIYSAFLCVFFLKSPFFHQMFRTGPNDQYFLTAFFGLFIFIGIFNSFNARTNRLNLLAYIRLNRIFIITIIFIAVVQLVLIYYGGSLFRTAGLTLRELEIMILLAFSVIPIDWIRKLYLRSRGIYGGV